MTIDFTDWTLVFDLDGTLVETAPDLHAALNYSLEAKRLGPVPIQEIRMMVGDGAKALIRKGLLWHEKDIDEHEIDATLWPRFLDYYRNNICRFSHVYDDAQMTLDSLAQAGATLCICTNKPQVLAEEVLRGLNINHYFKSVLGGDMAVSQKPDGSHLAETIALAGGQLSQAIMIGDSETDERAARDAGLPFVFVSFGYGQLSGEPFNALQQIDHWRDMNTALTKLANAV